MSRGPSGRGVIAPRYAGTVLAASLFLPSSPGAVCLTGSYLIAAFSVSAPTGVPQFTFTGKESNSVIRAKVVLSSG